MRTSDAHWRKSSYSGNGGEACLEVRDGVSGVVPVRDSKVTDGPVLNVPGLAWTTFVKYVKN